MKRIGIDARFYGPLGKGLGRYTQEVVDNVIKIHEAQAGKDCRFVVFLKAENFDEFEPRSANVKKVLLDIHWYSWREQIIMPFLLAKEKLDLIHYPHFNVPIFSPVKFVVTIHDLILTRKSTIRATTKNKYTYFFKNLAYRLVLYCAVLRSKKIIAVSEFTKQDIIKQYPWAHDKIAVTYEGVTSLSKGRDNLFASKIQSSETRLAYDLSGDFILYVGNAYPHKNLEKLLDVFLLLREEKPEMRLVLVGKIDFFYQRLIDYAKTLNLWQSGNKNSPVVFLGYVPDAQLEVLYQEAKAYVFPSLYEGFGLPPLEAMSRSCPVLSSDRSCLPEILGEAALYFNPESEADFLAKLKKILTDENLRERLIRLGKQQVKQYSWWECAHKTFNIYKEILQIKN